MAELTQEILDVVKKSLAEYGIKAELSIDPHDNTYKPWEGTDDLHYGISDDGKINHLYDTKRIQSRTDFFNRFRTEQFAKYAAATDKINHAVWQWKEKFDPTLVGIYWIRFFYPTETWVTSEHAELTFTFGPFSSFNKSERCIHDLKPYLDEYAKEMGWLNG